MSQRRKKSNRHFANHLIEHLEKRALLSVAYTAVDLGDLGGGFSVAHGINSGGQAVGESLLPDETSLHAALFSNGTVTDLGTLGASPSFAYGINASGVIVGQSNTSTGVFHAYSWSNGTMTDLGTLGGSASGASAINASGEVVGNADVPGDIPHAVVWNNGVITDLNVPNAISSMGTGIDSSGDVVGVFTLASGDKHAFYYDHTTKTVTDIGTLGGTASTVNNGISDAGVVAAASTLSDNTVSVFLYSNGVKTTLGNLDGTNIYPIDSNNNGQIVGQNTLTSNTSTGFIYTNGAFLDLNSEIDPAFGETIISANGINDAGQIVGQANLSSGAPRAFLLTPVAPVNAGITPGIASVAAPTVYVPGDSASAKITLTNNDAALHHGSLAVKLYLSTDANLDASDLPVISPATAHIAVNLKPGATQTVTAKFTVPGGISPGYYDLIAKLVPGAKLTAGDLAAAPAVFTIPEIARLQFGNVGGRPNVRLTRTLGDGTKITYSLTGPGTGTFSLDPTGKSVVSLTGTTLASKFVDTVSGGSRVDNLDYLQTNSSLGSIVGPQMHLGFAFDFSSAQIQGDISNILVGSATGVINVSSSNTIASISLGTANDAGIATTSGISKLLANSWTGSSNGITADFVTSLQVKGAFGEDLNLAANAANGGTGNPANLALGTATFGSLTGDGNFWTIGGSTGAISIKGSVAELSANVTGSIKSFTVGGQFTGDVAAANIASLTLKGSVSNAYILAGANFGPDGVLGGDDDTFATGTIGNLVVDGAVSTSLIGAGLNLLDDGIDGNYALIAGGQINKVVFARTLSNDSQVLAATLPKRVTVDGKPIDPITDARFKIAVP